MNDTRDGAGAGSSAEAWTLFDINALKTSLGEGSVEYKEFFRVPAIHCGLYRLERGATDMQTPHDEDEMYYVLEGRARMKIGEEVKEVAPGALLYVGATASHSFFEIEEDMLLLVFFSGSSR